MIQWPLKWLLQSFLFMCLIPTKPQSFREMESQWTGERRRIYFRGAQGALLRLWFTMDAQDPSWNCHQWDMAMVRLSSPTPRGTNSIVSFIYTYIYIIYIIYILGYLTSGSEQIWAHHTPSVPLPNLLLRKLVTPLLQMMFHWATVWQDHPEVKLECWKDQGMSSQVPGHINYWLTVKPHICTSLWTLCHGWGTHNPGAICILNWTLICSHCSREYKVNQFNT